MKKNLQVETEITSEGKIKFVLSTGNPDRDRDVIHQNGWELSNYLKNPVVLWAHDYSSLPIAKSTVWLEDGKLVGEAEFVSKDIYPFAETVKQLYINGFLKATSVGFRALEYTWDNDRRGYNIYKAELLEWSAVPVPANAEALLAAKSAGIDIQPLEDWFKTAYKTELTTLKAFSKLYEPTEEIEETEKAKEVENLKAEVVEMKKTIEKISTTLNDVEKSLLKTMLKGGL